MKDQTTYIEASTNLSDQRRKEILFRCFKMVDYLSDMAGDIILDFINNNTCAKARQLLLKSPESIAIKAFEKAISDLNERFSTYNRPMH